MTFFSSFSSRAGSFSSLSRNTMISISECLYEKSPRANEPNKTTAFISLILCNSFFNDSNNCSNWCFIASFTSILLSFLYGLSSLFVVDFTGWPRVTPYSIGGLAPLGYNHNMVAEALVAIIPISFYLWVKEIDLIKKKFKQIGLILMVLATLLTLSRAAWLSLILQAIIAVWYYRNEIKKWKYFSAVAFVVIAVSSAYMLTFLFGSSIVKSSNEARFEATKLAFFYTLRSPVIGHGPGSFLKIAESTTVMNLEFGQALDAHGMVQKVLVEEGIVGLVLFLLFLISIVYKVTRWEKDAEGDGKDLARAIACMTLGVILFQFFNTSYFSGIMWMPLGVALVAIKNWIKV